MKTRALESVCFEFTAPQAKEVCIAGSFNDWHPSVTPMVSVGNGKWAKELTLLSGRYEYRLVIDGKWADDPAVKERVPNPFGSANALLEVRPDPSNDAARVTRPSLQPSARRISPRGNLKRMEQALLRSPGRAVAAPNGSICRPD